MEGHGEPLEELDGTGVVGLELASSQRVHFGKLGPNSPGGATPASANGFHDQPGNNDRAASVK